MKNKKIRILFFLILVVMVGCSKKPTQEVEVVKEKTSVMTAESIKMTFKKSFLSIGEFQAGEVLEVYTGGTGTIQQILVSPGDYVVKEDVLFTLDDSEFENQYNATESTLRTVRDNAKTAYVDAQKKFEDQSILYNNGALSKHELDDARSSLSQLKKTYQNAATNYTSQTSILKETLEKRVVRAPIEGLVGAIYIEEDNTVQDIPAIELVNDTQMFVKAMVTGSVLANIAPGDEVTIYPDGNSTISIAGRVEHYNLVANEGSGLFEVEVLVLGTILGARTGSYVEVDFIVEERIAEAVLRKSVLTSNGETYLYVIEEGIAKKRKVETGLVEQQYIEIKAGLTDQAKIVIQGQSFLEDGIEVSEEAK